MSPPPTEGLGSILMAGANRGRVWEFWDCEAAFACGVMLENREDMEKKPAEATVGAKRPQDDPLANSK